LAVLRSNEATVDVAVAATDIAAGTTLELSHFDEVPVPADESLAARLLPATGIEQAVGKLVVRPMDAGDPILLSDLLAVDSGDGLRAMSIPIEQSRAVSGLLTRGDTVDIVLVADGVATFVAAGIEVLDVPSAETNALGARSGYAPTVAVDSSQALRIAAALDTGDVHIIRSTGAQDPDLMQSRAIDETAEGPSE
ncbi:MAG: RcpC/CpaB family pilus assembly protein, partial [Acidimicrobiia bacterium]|nr:RcpC/CpaB family pilus assembly protein [Acidimicrobiia bacterium]